MAGYQVAPGSSEFALVSKGWSWGLSCMDSSGQCRHQDCCEVFFGFWAVVCFKEGGTGCNKADYASVQCSFSSVVRAMVL